jgi:hypothetical protein
MQAKQQNQALTSLVQKMQQDIQAKMPQIDADKWKTAIDALTRIRVAEINASKDADKQRADIDAAMLETIMGQAHETAMQATDHQHEAGQAQLAAAQAQQQPQEATQ